MVIRFASGNAIVANPRDLWTRHGVRSGYRGGGLRSGDLAQSLIGLAKIVLVRCHIGCQALYQRLARPCVSKSGWESAAAVVV